MKYLRKYNEDFDDDLKRFCETYLSYLIDKGFKVGIMGSVTSIDPWTLDNRIVISRDSLFNWDEISDDFAPFYEMLKSEYELVRTYDINIAQARDESWAIKVNLTNGKFICLLDSQLEYTSSKADIISSIDIVVKQPIVK